MQFRHVVVAALALVAAASLAAGCGGGSSPGVADVGGTNTESSSSGSSPSGGTDGDRKNGAAFSACMRSHGVRNFPDPSSDGGIAIGPNMGIDPESATFKAAEKACQKLLDIKPPSAAEQAKMQEQALKYSACMRAHGVANFPDPQFSGGKATLKIGSGDGIDPSSPVFEAAQKACQKMLPGMTKGGAAPRGGRLQSNGGKTGS